jgi:hypothetical protein
MRKNNLLASSAALVATVTAVGALLAPAVATAREGNSIGHGVKCYQVLVSSINGVNTYKQVCRKGV